MIRNHILMANSSKHCKYQTFGLIELHNLSKSQLADKIFKVWKNCVYDYWVNIQLLKFWLFNSSYFQTTFVKNFTKKLLGFKIDFESTDKFLLLHQYLNIYDETMKQRPFECFLKFTPKSFFFFIHHYIHIYKLY